MIPIKTQEGGLRQSYVVWAISLVCAAALLRLATLPAHVAESISLALGAVPERFLAAPFAPSELSTLFTSAFLHAGWVHLIGNLLFLMVFGPAVENRLGHLRFAGLYLAAGALGTLAHIMTHPISAAPMVGASGAIAGVLGAHLVLSPRSRITTVIPVFIYFEVAVLPAAFVIAIWFLLQVASAVAPVATVGAPVAWFAHLGGFAVGSLVGTITKTGSRQKTMPKQKAAHEARP